MQGFVGRISHYESKRPQEKLQTSYAWPSDSTITFQSFENEIKVTSYRNAASGSVLRLHVLMLKAINSVFVLYFAK